MWPNGPQVDMYFARNHANELLCGTEIRRRCPKNPSSLNLAVASRLRRLADWLVPAPTSPSVDLMIPAATEPTH